MNSSEVIKRILNMGITQVDIGEFLNITRQTVAKIKDGGYFKLSSDSKVKLQSLENRTKDEIEKLFRISKDLKNIDQLIMKGNSDYLDAAFEGIEYMSYWLLDDKFKNLEKYHKYYYGHMNNFYPRYNQAALFMRDTLNRRVYPLVTFQLDYKNSLITQFCIKSFKPDFYKIEYSVEDTVFPITIQQFIDLIKEKIRPHPKFLLYKDYIDDDWQYVINNIKKNSAPEYELFDLSRLFNFFDNEQPYYGPLIEDVLIQFRIDFDYKKLLSNCIYRADKIVELVNMVSLEELSEKKHDKSSFMFDSHGLKRDNNFLKNERRKLKEEM